MTKNNRIFIIIIVVMVFILGASIRLFSFSTRTIFTLEQGITLQTTHDYLHGNFSLLGLPNVQRFTSDGLRIFSGPLYNYALMPIMYIFGNNPVHLTYFALFINLFTALAMYYLITKLSGKRIAFFSTLYFLFDVTMISQSLTIWILNPLPLIGLLGMYLLLRYKQKIPRLIIFLLGILFGTSISLEYMCLFTVIILTGYILYKSTRKPTDFLILIAGILIPLAPTIIFDIRHEWYHLNTLWQYTLDTINNPGQGSIRDYHVFHLYPLWFYFLGYITSLLSKTKYKIGVLIATAYVFYGSTQALQSSPIVTTPTLLEIGSQISSQADENYNIVYMPKSEYRAYALRYILTVMHNKPPMAIDAYPSSSELYVVATKDRSFEDDIPWEIATFNHATIHEIYRSPDKEIVLYKFSK